MENNQIKLINGLVQMENQERDDFIHVKTEFSRRILGSKSQPPLAFNAPPSFALEQNVVGVGVGEKITGNKSTGVRSIKFLVRVKLPESQLEEANRLPETIDGLPVDIEEVGLFKRLSGQTSLTVSQPDPRIKNRPAQPGSSIGFEYLSSTSESTSRMAGTFGALVKRNNVLYILSNSHVLSKENQLPIGSAILQPGLLDGGEPTSDKIAELAESIAFKTTELNQVDCAIARVLDTSQVLNPILFIGEINGIIAAERDMVVHKFGRSTGYRVGRITSTNTDVKVHYETGTFIFDSQIIIAGLDGQPFSDGGDSGSLILERSSNRAVGLLFAGSSQYGIANHIEHVLQSLGVTLA